MALNNFTIKEAINICCDISQNLKLNKDLPLVERYAEKDALDTLINLAQRIVDLNKSNGGQSTMYLGELKGDGYINSKGIKKILSNLDEISSV